jgi:pimeloyl-ACP methyl ester carboxylesterase
VPQRRSNRLGWQGRKPSLRWGVQRIAVRARGDRNAFELPHAHFWCDAEDGVRLSGTRIGADPQHALRDGTEPAPAVVLVHGFMAYRTKRPWRLLAERLAQRFTVYSFDLRGHGQSTGFCTGGELELLDVHAVVEHARARGHRRIVTVGGSLGGIAVVLEAAAYRDIDAVVSISTPAEWSPEGSKAVRRATWLFLSPVGRALAGRVMGTRISLQWGNPPPPAEVIHQISPIPLLIVHGDNDHFFPKSDAELLFERAKDPKRLLIIPGFGHSEDGFTDQFATQLTTDIENLLAAAPSR